VLAWTVQRSSSAQLLRGSSAIISGHRRMRLQSLLVCLAAGLLAIPAAARAQQLTAAAGATEPAFADKQGKELEALRLAGSPPKIDGRLDDEAWRLAQT